MDNSEYTFKLMGFVAYVCTPHTSFDTKEKSDNHYYLFVQEIVSLHPKQGIGSSLLVKALEHAESVYKNVTRIDLLVNQNNSSARAFYQRLGFNQMLPSCNQLTTPKHDELYLTINTTEFKKNLNSDKLNSDLVFTHYIHRERLITSDFILHAEITKSVHAAHGTTKTLPRDRYAECKTQYLVATAHEL